MSLPSSDTTVDPPGPLRPGADVAVRLRNVTKLYPGTVALDDVSMSVRRGTIHALLGGNGSGKSTAVKVLAGVVSAEPGGVVELGETVVDAAAVTPRVARAAGLRFVHQDLGVFAELSVADNLSIGHGYATTGIRCIDHRAVHSRAERLIAKYHIDGAPDTPLHRLSPSARALVAIARALEQDEDPESPSADGILVLDEPTAALPTDEANRLYTSLSRLVAGGTTAILISHRLDEVLEHTDTVTVLRDGRHVSTASTRGLTKTALAEQIAGRTVRSPDRVARTAAEVPRLRLSDVGGAKLRGVSLTVDAGEIVGIAGLVGSGRSSLLRTVFGVEDRSTGRILLDGEEVDTRSGPAAMMRDGVAFLPEDRATMANFADLTIRENLLAASVRRYWSGGRMRTSRERRDARALVTRFGIKAPDVDLPMSSLSGGNQQKVLLARWLSRDPRLLLLDEPSQGVDVGARADIYRMIREAAALGAAVLVTASEFDELATFCDRVLILRSGSVVSETTEPDVQTLTAAVYDDPADHPATETTP
ncbi:sugar ABC transporter ATP-binding protein [Pseudonocardia pini]|uniref:sugar ABC transporter ATP-binding protein n=1 Tax=Pseudonocardia pini TaxID=2758030 RepID=UPI0015F05DF2|nr:sugar ABC transporter ATP-binding protein [Pseudonocardia pini]